MAGAGGTGSGSDADSDDRAPGGGPLDPPEPRRGPGPLGAPLAGAPLAGAPLAGAPLAEPVADDPIGDVLVAWAAAIALAWLAFRLAPARFAWPLAAAGWVAVPIARALWRQRGSAGSAHSPVATRSPGSFTRIATLDSPGLGPSGLGWLGLWPVDLARSARWALVATLLVLPPFAVGYFAWRGLVDGLAIEAWRAPAAGAVLAIFAEHLLLAGLPEELFFRGYVQGRLAVRFEGARPRLLLANPPAVVLAAALFAVTHLAFAAEPLTMAGLGRLSTFFPGVLFGLLRERAGDIYAPAIFHALCNACLLGLHAGFVAA